MYRSPPSVDKPDTGLMDNRLITATRLILALSAVLISDDTLRASPYAGITRNVLILYIAYSSILYILATRRNRLQRSVPIWSYWVDIGWYTVLVGFSGGTNSFLFFGFLFAILVASFNWGFRSGVAATTVSALLFIAVGLAREFVWSEFNNERLLTRSLYVVVLGYLVAHWGGHRVTLNRRLILLKQITTLSSSRMGVDRFISSTIEQLRAFYDADICLLAIADPSTAEYHLYRVERDNPNTTTDAEPVPDELMHLLLTQPTTHAAIYSDSPLGWRDIGSTYYAYDVVRREPAEKEWNASKTLAAILDAKSFATVPLRRNNRTAGRLFLAINRQGYFNASDLDFLLQVTEHFLPIIDSIWLVDQLASEAAEEERQRIARDIHDSVIQPYIGLRMGLVGIRRKLNLEDGDAKSSTERLNEVINNAASDTDHLIEITDGGIGDLRHYVRGLRESAEGEASLSSAVRRFAMKFTRATGIDVEVHAEAEINVEDHIATEAFQMVVEGLSNIRRHTQSVRATIGLARTDSHLILRIENDGTGESAPGAFTPRSIKERAQTLGGRTNVEISEDGSTAVIVEIPL